MKTTSVVLAAMVLTVSCSKIKEFEEKTTSMEQTTKEMSGTTNDMKGTTRVMYEQIRSKEAEDTRNKKFAILNDVSKDIGEKLAAAAVYYRSFEFQLWTAEGNDDQHAREALYLDATNEFTRRMVDVYGSLNLKKMSPTKTGKNQNAEKAFYALSAALHFNHHFQEALVLKNPSVKLTSFYDIIKSALLKDSRGENLHDYEEILVSGENREIMINLVKARVDMLSALALKNLTNKKEMTLGQKTKGLLFKISGGKLGSIDLPEVYDQSNKATKNKALSYLDGALKARKFLSLIGEEKELEKTVKSAFKNIDLSSQENDGDVQEQEGKEEQKEEIRSLIDQLLK